MRVVLALVVLAGCPHPRSPEAPVAEVVGAADTTMSCLPQARACYEDALIRGPGTHGEIVVRVTFRSDGTVDDAVPVLDTVHDPALVACVERAVRAATPPPSGQRVMRIPILFTSDRTPPEVVRALYLQHGLVPEEGAPGTPDRPPARGTVETW